MTSNQNTYGNISTTYNNFAQVCPLCKGKGKVKKGFYEGKAKDKSPLTDLCKSCCGMGLIYNFFSIPYVPSIPDVDYIPPSWISDTIDSLKPSLWS